MNIDIKDLVLIGGGLFTLAIIVHGLWLAWHSRKEPLRLEIEHDLVPRDDDELARFRGELPNGGARVISPLQNDLDFDRSVPVLLDPVNVSPVAEEPAATSADPGAEETAPAVPAGIVEDEAEPIRAVAAEPVLPDTGPIVARNPRRSRPSGPDKAGPPRETPSSVPEPEPSDQELLVIRLFAPNDEHFTGEVLLSAMREQGLKYGEMNIFHRLDPDTRKTQFSVANVLEPGYFDLAEISNLASPGLIFFLQLPGPKNPGEALEAMIRIARAISQELGAVLKDENMSGLTPQTEEHYRERVAEFSRRQLSARV